MVQEKNMSLAIAVCDFQMDLQKAQEKVKELKDELKCAVDALLEAEADPSESLDSFSGEDATVVIPAGVDVTITGQPTNIHSTAEDEPGEDSTATSED